MANNINFDSFFTARTIDQNGLECTDINAGLNNLHLYINENEFSLTEVQRYLVSDYEEAYPDLVAKNSVLGHVGYWWWILLLNKLEDALVDIKSNWVYSINSSEQINTLIEGSTSANEAVADVRIGETIELN